MFKNILNAGSSPLKNEDQRPFSKAELAWVNIRFNNVTSLNKDKDVRRDIEDLTLLVLTFIISSLIALCVYYFFLRSNLNVENVDFSEIFNDKVLATIKENINHPLEHKYDALKDRFTYLMDLTKNPQYDVDTVKRYLKVQEYKRTYTPDFDLSDGENVPDWLYIVVSIGLLLHLIVSNLED